MSASTGSAWLRTDRAVAEVMTRDVVTIGVDATLQDAAALIADRHVPALPVVDADAHLVGILSASDLLPRLEAREHLPRSERHRVAAESVATLMSRHVRTVFPTTSVGEAAEVMQREGLHHLPVVDGTEGGTAAGFDTVVGIVTRSDLAVLLVRDDHELRAHIIEDIVRGDFVLDDSAVDVGVHDGIVRLGGQVPSATVHRDLVEAVSRCAGVIAVHDRMSHRIDDSDSRFLPPWYLPPSPVQH